MSGICYLVGAGPGDVGLTTQRAVALIRRADVIIHDYLANPALLALARPDAELIYVGKKAGLHTVPQDGINRLIIEKTQAGKSVVRLKGGDPFLFGRGGEECEELRAAGCPFEVVPGVTAALGAAAWAGIPLTHRDFASAVAFITGHEDPTKTESSLDWKALASFPGTLVFYMGMERIESILQKLHEHGIPSTRAAAVVNWAATPRQRTVVGTVETLPQIVREKKIGAPSIIIVGDVAQLHETIGWREKLPLHGQRFILTRTRTQASRLRELLEEEGAEVVELPTIRIERIPTNPLLELPLHRAATAPRKIELRGSFDAVAFTSQNAVENFWHFLLELTDLRALDGLTLAAVGNATAKTLRQHGLWADFIPQKPTAEGLTTEWNLPKNARVLFPCGRLASTELEVGLASKNVQVTRLEVYQTVPDTEASRLPGERLAQEGADWLLFASSSAVENFHALGLKLPAARNASIGPSTSAALKSLGYSIDFESTSPDPEKMVSELSTLIQKEKSHGNGG